MPTQTRLNRTPEDYLKRPYARVLLPEPDGTYSAEILEFPGCLAQGHTAQEAIANLEEAAKSWIAAALTQNQEIPEPTDNRGFSGRMAVRLPRGLHRQATMYAEREGTSLNQFVVTAVATYVGAESGIDKVAERVFAEAFRPVNYYSTTDMTISFETTNNVVLSTQPLNVYGVLGGLITPMAAPQIYRPQQSVGSLIHIAGGGKRGA